MVNLTYNGFEVFAETFDLCYLLTQVGIECPVVPGKFTSGGTVTLPGDLPSVSASHVVIVTSHVICVVYRSVHYVISWYIMVISLFNFDHVIFFLNPI